MLKTTKQKRNVMGTLILFVGVFLVVMSSNVVNNSHILKMLGFVEDARDLFQFGMVLFIIGFALFAMAYPRLSLTTFGLYTAGL